MSCMSARGCPIYDGGRRDDFFSILTRVVISFELISQIEFVEEFSFSKNKVLMLQSIVFHAIFLSFS